jgi:AAA domain (dynein-related subfamily)
MREAEFREWLEAQGYEDATVLMQVNRVRRIEQSYGDLDALIENGGLQKLQQELTYSKADERAQNPNPAKFPIEGNIYNNMATYRKTLDYYRQFSEGGGVLQANGQNVTGDAIEAAMDEFDAIGLDGFKAEYGFGTPQKYWVRRPSNEKLYPAKAIVGVSHGYVAGVVPLKAADFYGGQGEQAANGILRKLGYEVVEKDALDDSVRPFVLYDAEGHEYQPTRTFNRKTGISAFRLQRSGTSNRTEDAEEVEATVDVARAMLVDGRLARVKRTDGTGSANYIGYGKTKLVRYRLDADLARQIGVPEQGGVDDANRGNSNQQKEPDAMPRPMTTPTNLILYGPPGTGKTYRTALEAVKLCDPDADYPETAAGRSALMARYRELEAEKRIAFVTFHQNYDYETFVEGLRPETGDSDGGSVGFRLEARAGIFREICALADQARTRTAASASSTGYDFSGRRFWKMGQGAIGTEDDVYESAIANHYITLGWGGSIDWTPEQYSTFEAIKAEWLAKNPEDTTPSNWTQTWPFRCEMKVGDIVIVPYGNTAFRAIAEVTGDYRFEPSAEGYYAHRRDVRWLLTLDEPLPLDTIVDGNFTMRTLYPLLSKRVNLPAIGRLIAGDSDSDSDIDALLPSDGMRDQFVLIIDEINRANISKVFGELITLIEPDKRLGMSNEITLTLPYSKKRDFGVPANLHIIGTMNTADRSIALLDTALRRRFVFRELAPDPSLLEDASRETGIDLVRVLTTINQRIEYLIDREHRIGHAFFIGCETAGDVDAAMRDKVIPLLQEYFFEDWSRIHAVLGDGFVREDKLDPPPGIEGDRISSWSVFALFKTDAFERLTGKPLQEVES